MYSDFILRPDAVETKNRKKVFSWRNLHEKAPFHLRHEPLSQVMEILRKEKCFVENSVAVI